MAGNCKTLSSKTIFFQSSIFSYFTETQLFEMMLIFPSQYISVQMTAIWEVK